MLEGEVSGGRETHLSCRVRKEKGGKASSMFLLWRRAIDHLRAVTKALCEYTTVHKFEFLKRHEVA